MPRIGRNRHQLGSPIWRAPSEDEVRTELDFHLEMLIQELQARGLPPNAARAEAVRRFGDPARVTAMSLTSARERDMTQSRGELLAGVVHDWRFALRQLRRNPGFSLVILLTLAVGIGATTAIFSVVHAVLLRPFAYAQPDRVVFVAEEYQGRPGNMSVGNFVDLEARARSFDALAAIAFQALNVSDDHLPDRVLGARVTAGLFRVVGTRPLVGRLFDADEDRPGFDDVAVLSHGLWLRRFGGDSAAIGRTLRLNGRPYRVIGVMPPGFDPTLSGEQLWIPAAFTPAQRAQHDEHYLNVLGLLRTGVSRERAQQELAPLMQELATRYPEATGGRGVVVVDMQSILVGNLRDQLLVLFGAVLVVLLIACANVSNLLLARGAARAKELALRAAIGAGRGRLVRQLLTETGVIALVASVLGVGIAAGMLRVLVTRAPQGLPRVSEAGLDVPVLIFALALGVGCSLLAGGVPALRAVRRDPQADLRESGRGMGGVRDRVRAVLVCAEVAMAVTLLVSAGLLIRSAILLQRTDPGFDPTGVLVARISLPESEYREPGRVVNALTRIAEGLAARPGVIAAGVSSQVPMGPGGGSNGLVAEGKVHVPGNAVDSRLRLVTPGYLRAMGIPLRRGREFSDRDITGAERVALVSEETAKRLWPGEDPLGKRFLCCEGSETDPRPKTVVGVVGNVHSRGLGADIIPEFYLPVAQAPDAAWDWIQRSLSVVARTRAPDPIQLGEALRASVHDVDRSVPVAQVTPMARLVEGSTATARFNTLLLSTLGAVGLLLAAVGIYGVVAYFVSLRAPEIGIRLALGATGPRVLGLLVAQGMRPVAIGVALGVGGALLAARALATSLYGVAPTDPVTLAAVVALLLVVGAIATLIPARRALRISPTTALAG